MGKFDENFTALLSSVLDEFPDSFLCWSALEFAFRSIGSKQSPPHRFLSIFFWTIVLNWLRPLRIYFFCPVVWAVKLCGLNCVQFESRVFGFCFFLPPFYYPKVPGLFSLTFLFALQWWYSYLNLFSVSESVKSKLFNLFLGLNFVLFELIACASSLVKYFDLASGMKFFGKAISLVDSRCVF